MNKGYFTAKKITWFAILLALVIVLQIWGSAIPVGATRLSFTLVPIVLGAIILGATGGMLLGIAFGAVVLISALVGADPFTAYLLQGNPVMTLLIIFVKGAMCGLVPGLLFKALKNKNTTLALIVASVSAPLVNTGIFIIGALMISGVISSFISSVPDLDGQSVVYFIIIGCAGVNFLVELLVNAVVSPALMRIIKAVDKSLLLKSDKKVSAEEKTNTEEMSQSESEYIKTKKIQEE